MRTVTRLIAALLMVLSCAGAALAQMTSNTNRERARIPYRLGWEYMRAEKYPEAVKSFQQSIDIDPKYEFGYYGLGRAYMMLKRYTEAAATLEQCRDLYRVNAGTKFSNAQDAQRMRQDSLMEIDEQIRLLNTARPTNATADLSRQYSAARRTLEDSFTRGQSVTIETSVPPWVTLSLGSAYFRSGKLEEAEHEYRATVAADPKCGEAHSNLAVVLLETGRIAEADASLKDAKKVGFKVNPQLEQAIRDKMKK